MLLGYNTNGLVHHRLLDAIDLLADEGYQSIAITLDARALDPFEDPALLAAEVTSVRRALDDRGLARVVETGAPFILNPRGKHHPTLLDPDPSRRAIRQDFLIRSIDIGRALDARAVSLWSGQLLDQVDDEVGMERLATAMKPVLDHAAAANMPLVFEPEPDMFIDTAERFGQLYRLVEHPLLYLTVDIGHAHCTREGDIPTLIRKWSSRILNVHIEDMVAGVHDHLMFGEGTIDFPPIFEALHDIEYQGGVHVELSRHSHVAAATVRASAEFLAPLIQKATQRPGSGSVSRSSSD
jgi:sugar phosphate isomerase/epimerase